MSEETQEVLGENTIPENNQVQEPVNKTIDLSSFSMEELITELENLCEIQNPYSVSKRSEEIKTLFYKSLKSENNIEDISEEDSDEDSDEDEEKKTLHPLEVKFKNVNNKFRKIKSDYRKNREKEENKNLIIKENIISDIDKLSKEEESLKVTFEKFKDYQNKWNNTGRVPITKSNDLWQNYHHHVELFYDYIKINKELRDLDFKRNLEQKTIICEKSEKLSNDKSINTAFNSLQELHEHWKNIGPVSRKYRESIWERFQTATRKINKNRNDYFLNKKRILKGNTELKSSICKEINKLSEDNPNTHQQWNNLSEKLNELSEKWKKAAPIEKSDLKKSWTEFREATNEFYSMRNNFYKNRKEDNNNNLQEKIKICEQAEELSTSTNWKETGKQLIQLQEKWKNSAFVPKNLSDKIWKRFRSACNKFFDARKKHYKLLDKEKEGNLKEKTTLLKEVQKFDVSENPREDIKRLKEFSEKWNSIGFVPKQDIQINDRFDKVISSLYNKLKVDKSEKKTIQFQIKAERLKGNSDKLNVEKELIREEIGKVNKTILQYENNISFFGNGKGTEKLKEDVLKNIENSKKEIEELKKKLSLLNKI
ncbi:MAG: DUF349 domain-containing protein [Flavobacteriales bacterium]|nr:DUF349 domain-containing protein [Flavobacteriales bacterium]